MCDWASLFNPGRSFGQYLAHLPKARLILGVPIVWNDPASASTAKGFRRTHDLGVKFENNISRAHTRRLIRRESLYSELCLLVYLSFLFPFGAKVKGPPFDRLTLLSLSR